MTEKLGIIQSRGLGDIVISLPIARYYYDQGWEIHWPICREFLTHFYQTCPWINWHPVETDREGTFFLDQPRSILKKLGVKEGHVRDDGEYSLEFMECLADCGQGPVVIVDEKTYENVEGERAEKFADLLLDGKLEESDEFVSYEDALLKKTKE